MCFCQHTDWLPYLLHCKTGFSFDVLFTSITPNQGWLKIVARLYLCHRIVGKEGHDGQEEGALLRARVARLLGVV